MIKTDNSFKLRNVYNSDKNQLFEWANDIETRKWSFHSEAITVLEHKKWFNSKYIDKNVILWIFEYENTSSGLVRLEKYNGKVIIHYQIAPEMRGKKLASVMLEEALKKLKKCWLVNEVYAFTYPENLASIKSLKKAGFNLFSDDGGKHCYLYRWSNKIKIEQK